MKHGIACMSGGFKGVFVHGVLRAFEDMSFVADAYAAASSSILPAAYAAARRVGALEHGMWAENANLALEMRANMSEIVLGNIRKLSPLLRNILFGPSASRFLIATSLVINEEAISIVQSPAAVRLGRRLLLDAARRNASWQHSNLKLHLFDTHASDPLNQLTSVNFEDVAYATTRMLHAWPKSVSVNGQQHIDASYTSLCPALNLASLGYDVIVIATEPGPIPYHIFTSETIPEEWNGFRISVVSPERDLREFGVDFLKSTPEGVIRCFNHGLEKGRDFVRTISRMT